MVKSNAVAAQLNHAVALHRRGDIGAAAQIYQQIIDHDPRNADAYQLLAVIARQMDRRELALQLLTAALALNPRHAAALANHALLLREAGDVSGAKKQAEAAVQADPHYAEGHIALGGLLQAERSLPEALAHYRTALRQQPDNPLLLNSIATVEHRLGHLAEAYAAVMRALAITPEVAELYNTRGNILRAAGYPDAACAAFATAYARDPALTDARINEALARLLIGDFARGWELFAQRGKADPRVAQVPLWDGQINAQSVLLLQAEQGLGDVLQFVRLLPWAAARVQHVVLAAPESLHALLKLSFPHCTLIAPDHPVPAAVTHRCRLLDLAGLVPLRDDQVPGAAPYLVAPDRPLPELLAGCVAPRIGLVWSGNPGHLNDANRSLRLTQLTTSFAPFAPHLVSLQKDAPGAELSSSGLGVIDAAPLLTDFAATAALLRHIDLVITVDTSMAHLAGALGRPVWIMVPFDPDWRWQLERRDVPWYPTAKLYRQSTPGAWEPVIAVIGQDVARLVAGDRSVLTPPRWEGLVPQRQAQGAVPLPGFTS